MGRKAQVKRSAEEMWEILLQMIQHDVIEHLPVHQNVEDGVMTLLVDQRTGLERLVEALFDHLHNHSLGHLLMQIAAFRHYAARVSPEGFYNLTFPVSQITRRNLITGDEDILTDAPGSAMRPEISPDGNLLLI
jgi:hypothetical protein